MVGLPAETGAPAILRDIDQFDAIGVAVSSANQPGMLGLLEHAYRTLDLLRNSTGAKPLQPVPYTIAQIQAILDFLTGETAAPHLRNDESARVAAYYRQADGSRNRWNPMATDSTGHPATLADPEVWTFEALSSSVIPPGGLVQEPLGRVIAPTGRYQLSPTQMARMHQVGTLPGLGSAGTPIYEEDFSDDDDIADGLGR